jgi:predicted negative regulator of RcsB-dependent stress response
MVDEYLSEREQAEQLKTWLRANWIWLFAGVALALGGFYGSRWWESRQAGRSLAAEERMTAMLDALSRNQREEALKVAGELTGDYAGTPYADQATLVLARLDIEGGDLAAAAAKLARVMESSRDPELSLVARLRLARVQLAQGEHDAALATLDSVASTGVDARIAELRGDALYAKGDHAGALAAFRQAQEAAAGAPPGLVDGELLSYKIDELATAATE